VSKPPVGGESMVFGGHLAIEVGSKVDILPPRVGDKEWIQRRYHFREGALVHKGGSRDGYG